LEQRIILEMPTELIVPESKENTSSPKQGDAHGK
jgi:hypothetical protein